MMEQEVADLLSAFHLPPEIIAEIDAYLRAYYIMEGPRKVAEMIRLYTRRIKPNRSLYVHSNIYDAYSLRYHSCPICGDILSVKIYNWIARETINYDKPPFWRSHAPNCLYYIDGENEYAMWIEETILGDHWQEF